MQDHALPAAPLLINPDGLVWQPTIPEAGERSPAFAILSEDAETGLTMLMFKTPVAVHIRPHTHGKAETHVVMRGGTHVFSAGGERYEVEAGGFLRMPGGVVHEAWLPAGSLTVNVLESGWVVDWTEGGPSAADVGETPPPR